MKPAQKTSMIVDDRFTGQSRLRIHPSPTEGELSILSVIDPHQLPFDPAAPEARGQDRRLFIGGLSALWQRLFPEQAR